MVKPKRHSPILMRSPIYKKTHSVKQTNKQTYQDKEDAPADPKPKLRLVGVSDARMSGTKV